MPKNDLGASDKKEEIEELTDAPLEAPEKEPTKKKRKDPRDPCNMRFENGDDVSGEGANVTVKYAATARSTADWKQRGKAYHSIAISWDHSGKPAVIQFIKRTILIDGEDLVLDVSVGPKTYQTREWILDAGAKPPFYSMPGSDGNFCEKDGNATVSDSPTILPEEITTKPLPEAAEIVSRFEAKTFLLEDGELVAVVSWRLETKQGQHKPDWLPPVITYPPNIDSTAQYLMDQNRRFF